MLTSYTRMYIHYSIHLLGNIYTYIHIYTYVRICDPARAYMHIDEPHGTPVQYVFMCFEGQEEEYVLIIT